MAQLVSWQHLLTLSNGTAIEFGGYLESVTSATIRIGPRHLHVCTIGTIDACVHVYNRSACVL